MTDIKKQIDSFIDGVKKGMTETQKNMAVVRRGRKGYIILPGGNINDAISCQDWETLVEELRLLLHPEHAKGN